jgi:hypothetical protein
MKILRESFFTVSALIYLCCLRPAAASTTVCVTDTDQLQQALIAAQTATTDTFIDIATGTYTGPADQETLFYYQSTSNTHQLELTGGYSSDCSTHNPNPYMTVFDGGDSDAVFVIRANGGVSIRWMTVQNGAQGALVSSELGPIVVNYNVFRNNEQPSIAINVSASASNKIEMWGNLIHNNSSDESGVPVSVWNFGSGDIFFTNNTVADNLSLSTDSDAQSGANFSNFGTGKTYLANDIFWSNLSEGSDPLDVSLVGPSELSMNEIGSAIYDTPPTVDGGFVVDPQFVSNTNFRLAPTSPLLQQGTLTPAGGLPSIDLLGNPRTFNNAVDLGAFERNDDIFKDGFDGQ